ncbi:MAG TPA: tetratricopeptide repeat protein [Bryobacteraceae bacterium]|nr:tetratricopeptide repeat protein [Bryobacteraceae bacterium]
MLYRPGFAFLVVSSVVLAASAQKPARKPAPHFTAPAAFESAAARAAAAREGGRTGEAIELYRSAVGLRASWAEGWWHLGTLYYDSDQYTHGSEAFARFVKLEPKAGPGFGMLGLCEFQLERYSGALAAFMRARRLGLGENGELSRVVRYHAAIVSTRLGMPEAALPILDLLAAEDANRGVAETPAMIEAFGLAGLCRRLLPAEIPEDKRELVRMAGRARLYTTLNNRTEAFKLLDALAAAYPGEPGVHYLRGSVLISENAAAAVEEFERELKVSPRDIPSRLQIALQHLATGEHERGLPYAEQAVELAPQNFAARTVLGRLLLSLEKTERAIAELERAAQLAPESPDVHFSLGQAYALAGRAADAERERAAFRRLDALRQAALKDAGIPADEIRKP